jgi:hypothetical protein
MRRFVLLLIAGLCVWFFADALFRGGMFVFRDAAHYYYPLLRFVGGEWKAGRVPLWNPYENLGVPLAGNATSGAFYPGMLVFLLPIGFDGAYRLYVMGHVLLAAWGAYGLGRHWKGSVEGAGLGAMSYAFGGSVLFQYCNVVFLVGAAWLAPAVLAADRMLAARSRRGAVALGAVLAMMTLGGNAEMAYHAGLIAALYAAWLWRHERRARAPSAAPGATRLVPATLLSTRSRPVLLGLAAAAGLLLGAVQVLPSIEFTRRSGRSSTDVPRTIYEAIGFAASGARVPAHRGVAWYDGLTCRRLEPGTHHQHVYQFSVGPWRLAEYVWPNVSGRQFPRHRRWLSAMPGEARVWVPSLYMGILPLVLALASLRFRGGDVRQSGLSWLVVLSLVASFGWYGLGWIAGVTCRGLGADPDALPVGAPFGGLYWLMTVLLPGYVYFRYPAKLLVIAALGLSMLAVRGWDSARDESPGRARRLLAWLGAISLMGAIAAPIAFRIGRAWLSAAPPDMLFGPLDVRGAASDLKGGMAQTALLCAVFWVLLRRVAAGSRRGVAAVLLVAAVDLAVANGWMIVCAPADAFEQEPKLAVVLRREEASPSGEGPYRVYRHPLWFPSSYASAGAPDRLEEAVRWERDTLWPKYNLTAAIPIAEVDATMKPFDYQVVLWLAKRRQRLPFAPRSTEPPEAQARFFALDAIGAKYVIGRAGQALPGLDPVELAATGAEGLEDVALWRNPSPMPRAWIVHEVEAFEPLTSNDPYAVWRRTDEVFRPRGRWRELRQSAAVEMEPGTCAPTGPAPNGPAAQGPDESCRVVRHEATVVEIEATLSRPGLVVLCDQYDPGWRLEVATAGRPAAAAPVLRANRVMRGAWLPAGEHRLSYRYRPASFVWGVTISAAAWLALGAACAAAAYASWRENAVETVLLAR